MFHFIDETAESHQPVLISGKRHNAVLVSEDDWRSMQETLYLVSIPGIRDAIIEGLRTPVEECRPRNRDGEVAVGLHPPGAEGRPKSWKAAGLKEKATALLEDNVEANPFQTPPPYEKLVGDLTGAYSRKSISTTGWCTRYWREERIVKVIRLWSHYE